MKVQPKQILVALDYDSFNQAERICNLLNPDKFRIKVGKQLFSAEGPKILEKIHKLGFEIFLDLKIHDIPNTVYKSLLNIFNLNVWMTNIHLLGGQEMIQAAKQAQSHRGCCHAAMRETKLKLAIDNFTSRIAPGGHRLDLVSASRSVCGDCLHLGHSCIVCAGCRERLNLIDRADSHRAFLLFHS